MIILLKIIKLRLSKKLLCKVELLIRIVRAKAFKRVIRNKKRDLIKVVINWVC